MNKFEIIDAGQRLRKCSDNLNKTMAMLSRATSGGEKAFSDLSDALIKINEASSYLEVELREVI